MRGLGPPIRRRLPVAVFSPSAEQLRWDAYRTGHLAAADWSRVRAQVEPVRPPGNDSGSEFAFALTLVGGAAPVRRIFRPGQLQSVQMALDAEPALGGQVTAATLYWDRRDPLPVPLAPMALPATRDNGWTPRRELGPARLIVGDAIRSRLAEVCARSLDLGTELGGRSSAGSSAPMNWSSRPRRPPETKAVPRVPFDSIRASGRSLPHAAETPACGWSAGSTRTCVTKVTRQGSPSWTFASCTGISPRPGW